MRTAIFLSGIVMSDALRKETISKKTDRMVIFFLIVFMAMDIIELITKD